MALWDVRAAHRPVLTAQMPQATLFGAYAVHDGTRASTARRNASCIVVGCYGDQGHSNELRVYDVRGIGSQAAALHHLAQHTLPAKFARLDASGSIVTVASSERVGWRSNLYLEWWDMQRAGGAGECVGRTEKLQGETGEPFGMHVSDDGRMMFINDGVGRVRCWCWGWNDHEQPYVEEGMTMGTVGSCVSLDAADTLVVYGCENRVLHYFDYGGCTIDD